jgi:hypothetical protein
MQQATNMDLKKETAKKVTFKKIVCPFDLE